MCVAKRFRSAALVLVVLAFGAVACGGASSSGPAPSASPRQTVSGTSSGVGDGFASSVPLHPSKATGGTLRIGSTSDVGSLDPARSDSAAAWDLLQLTNRTMLTFPAGGSRSATTPLGGLATGPAQGRHDDTVWSYRLRSGIRFQDGTPVTAKDIKYSVERVFATSVVTGGPISLITFLCPGGKVTGASCQGYAGPYHGRSSEFGLTTVRTPSARRIVFHLNRPFPEWNDVMTLLDTSPVEPRIDQVLSTGGAHYAEHVQATGPYEIASAVPNRHLHLIRNPQWSRSQDPVRTALPDTVDVTFGMTAQTLDAELVSGAMDLDIGGSGVQALTQARILNTPALRARTLDPLVGSTRYLSVLAQTVPLTNVYCRRAVGWAISRTEQLAARGGDDDGVIATALAPPSLVGDHAYDPYPTSPVGSADDARATHELAACGKPTGFSTTLVVASTAKDEAQARLIKADLAAIGVVVTVKAFDPATYQRVVLGRPATIVRDGYGLALDSWRPTWPTPYGFYESIVDPRSYLPEGNHNDGDCNDPLITATIQKALRQPTAAARSASWGQVDRTVTGDACDVPLVYDKAVDLFSARLSNVSIEPDLGIADVRTLGVG